MCGQERVRYIHVMEHEDHPEQLRCGCDCAGAEDDLAAAQTRGKSLKRKLKADARWLEHGWKRSQAGTEYRKQDGTHIVIFGGGAESWGIASHQPGRPRSFAGISVFRCGQAECAGALSRGASDLEKSESRSLNMTVQGMIAVRARGHG